MQTRPDEPSSAPFRLCTLGCVALERGGAPVDSVGRQRKMLALLAVLSVAGRRGISREKVEALLWPESDDARARGALKQALHSLRRQLGTHGAVLGVKELRLNDAVVESDVDRFLGGLEAGEPEDAVAFYAGPFLDGFHLPGLPEFERWVESRRDDLGRRHAAAVEQLAVAAGARGDHAAAVRWWRRLNDADPLSSRVTIELMRALEALGERPAAIRCAAAHETLLREELGAPADPEVAGLAVLLRGKASPAELADVPPPDTRHPTPPGGLSLTPAYNLYLHARQQWRLRTADGIQEAIRYYEAAAELDPEFARAWAGLGESYVNLSNLGRMSTVEALALAEGASDRAIQLDATLPEAHAARGFVLTSRLAFTAAEDAFRNALRLNAHYTWAHHYYTLLLLMLGRTEEALAHNDATLRSDPLSRPANATRGVILCQEGEYAAAVSELERALTLSSDYPVALAYLGAVQAACGDVDSAIRLVEKAAGIAPDFPNVPAALVHLQARAGRRREAESVIAELRGRADEPRARVNLALALGALRRLDEAFDIMADVRWDVPSLIALRADPLLQEVREDPRYGALLQGIGACAASLPGP